MNNTILQSVSCVIIAKNAAASLKNTLDSLTHFDDVVVYNNGSCDHTKSIAQSFTNVNLIEGDFIGFGPTKNKAASFARHDWVLSLDADEVLSTEFIQNLQQTTFAENTIYTILRENFYQATKISHCWGQDIIPRIYPRKKTAFTDKLVHESIISDGFNVSPIAGTIKHYPYASISDFIVKLDRYSSLYAEDNQGKKSSSPFKAFINAQFAFFKTYLLKRGFLDGYPGLVIAFSHMATTFYKLIKLYELNNKLK